MPFQDKNEFEASDQEDESLAGAFPEESPDDEEELSEEELAAEMEPFTVADWKKEIPDYTAEEFEERLPERTRAHWMTPFLSCLFGTLLGAAIAGLNVNNLPRSQQVRTFFAFFPVLALLFSCAGYLFFVLRPKSVAKKMEDEQENLVDSESIQRENPAGPEPIHPK